MTSFSVKFSSKGFDTMTRNLLAMAPMLSKEMEELEAHFTVVNLWKEDDPEDALHRLGSQINAILSTYNGPKVTNRLMAALPNLEVIAQYGVGVNNIDLVEARRRNIAVTNTPDVLTDDVADLAMGLLLSVMRRICEADMFVRVGQWTANSASFPLATSLTRKTMGIVGLGRIGRAIARRAEAFGIEVVYHGRSEKTDVAYRYYPDLKEMAKKSDILMLACEGGVETEGLVNEQILNALGPKGVLINIARGSVVDEKALIQALVNKQIAAAGLDVYAKEPYIPEDLKKMDNVVLLPHIASATTETRSVMGELVIENLLAHFDGRTLITPV
jgi:lactate dehydrogenase-like 2-hydroxyacid dehydrogenase